MKFLKIALTGGPCGGKSAALCRIEEEFIKFGYKVFLINETATELRSMGISPESMGSVYEYQSKQFELQTTKEDVCGQDALASNAEKILIVCDRGLPDNAAYLSMNDYHFILREHSVSRAEALLRYDAVFFLRSAANKSSDLYHAETNPVRTETPKKAIELDEKLLLAWAEHPHLFVIDANDSFDDKMKELLTSLTEFAEEGKPFLYKEKYIIDRFDFATIPYAIVTETETYMLEQGASAIKETRNGEHRFKMIRGNDIQYITYPDFLNAVSVGDNHLRKIAVTRYGFRYRDEYITIESYPHLDKTAVMTVEKRSDKEETAFPDYITVLEKFK